MTWDKEAIQSLLANSDKAVARAVVAIYNLQTDEEKRSEQTLRSNGVGFSGTDARRGTYYAQYILRTGSLTGKHLELARKMTQKYWRQLAEIANAAPAVAVESHAHSATAEERRAYRARKDGEDIGNYEEARMVAREMDGHW